MIRDLLKLGIARNTRLHFACWNGSFNIVQLILERALNKSGANKVKNLIDRRNIKGYTALHCATINGHLKIAEYLLSNGADHTIKNNKKETPLDCLLKKHEPQELLELAIKEGFPMLAGLSINAGADVKLVNRDEQFTSPLSRAVDNNNLAVVKVLVENGAVVGFAAAKEGNMVNMLHLASGHCNTEMMEFFIKEGLDVNEADFYDDTALHIVIKSSKSEEVKLAAVELLLANKANINAVGDEGKTPMHIAVKKENLEIARALLDKGSDIKGEAGKELLFLAAENEDFELVRLLIGKGVDINTKNRGGETLLHIAVEKGHLEIVRALLEKNADINAKNQYGNTPLLAAIEKGHLEITRALLDKGADIKGEAGKELLFLAAENEDFELVRLLIGKGVDINTKNRGGETLLHIAVEKGHLEIVRALLEKNADINAKNQYGNTPLLAAIEKGHLEITRALLDKGADINIEDNHGKTALDLAKEKGHTGIVDVFREKELQGKKNEELFTAITKEDLEAVKKAIESGADVNAIGGYGRTPLFVAARNGNLGIVRLLLEHGADVNAANKYGRTPLYVASQGDNLEVVKELLKHGADVNAADKYGSTPLHIAASNGNLKVVRLLLEHGADVNAADKYGWTALRSVVQNDYNKLELIKTLLECENINVNITDENGLTPLYIAVRCDHKEASRLIIQHLVKKNADKPDYLEGEYSVYWGKCKEKLLAEQKREAGEPSEPNNNLLTTSVEAEQQSQVHL